MNSQHIPAGPAGIRQRLELAMKGKTPEEKFEFYEAMGMDELAGLSVFSVFGMYQMCRAVRTLVEALQKPVE